MQEITNQKVRKLLYYTNAYTNRYIVPNAYFRKQLKRKLDRIKDEDRGYILDRLNHYHKVQEPFTVSDQAVMLNQVPDSSQTVYYYDFLPILQHFPEAVRFDYAFGDVNWIPEVPSLVKSRPIAPDNANGIVMKLEAIRHFRPIIDPVKYEDKIDKLVWRGAGWQPHRRAFLKQCWDHPLCDVGQVNEQEDTPAGWMKAKMSIPEQLQYKFVLSIEGNDVATNLKWIAQSNSLCFMTKPKMETWFMEERLVPNVHYVELRDDYADVEEKINHFIAHPNEAKDIIHNFQQYYEQFRNPLREELISLMVVEKYLSLSGQL